MSVFQLGTTAEFKKRLLGLSREDLLEIIQDQNPKYIHQIQMIEDTFRFRLRHLTWSDGTPVEGKDLTNKELSDLIDPPFIFDKDIARKWGINEDQQRQIHFAADPVLWARHMLDVNIRVYQTLVLRDSNINKVMRFGRRAGKALSIDTLIPTPNGWTTMKDLQPGDSVFDETGTPCTVTDVTDVQWNRNCFKVHFSDGSHLIADEDHQWTVDTNQIRKNRGRNKDESKWSSITLTTKDMIDNLYVDCGGKLEVNYSIELAGPVKYSEKEQPIPAYLLGLWLGDGTNGTGKIDTADKEIIDYIQNELKFEVTKWKYEYSYNIVGLNKQLRLLNLQKDQGSVKGEYNKFIPDKYLYGSVSQREELLKGLMDSDGYCDSRDGSVEYCSTDEILAKSVLQLILSLGYRASLKEGDSYLSGKHCGKRFRITWTPNRPVFKLSRKLNRQILSDTVSSRNRYRYIVAIEKIDSVPVKCITVDSPNSLYLAGENFIPTHNTFTLAVFMLWYAYTHNDGRIIVMTPMKAQSGLIYDEIIKLAKKNKVVMDSITRNVTSPQYEINFSNGTTIRLFTTGMKSGSKCFTPDHEVLTEDNGWKSIENLSVGDIVLSFDKETEEMVWKSVEYMWEYDYDGDIIDYDGRQLSYSVTPNHKILAKSRYPQSKWAYRTAESMIDNLVLPTVNGRIFQSETNIYSKEELELWGWWLSEGSGYIGKMVRISQVKEHGRARIIELAKSLGLHYTTPQREIRIEWKPPIYSGVNAYNKFIPRELLFETNRHALLDGLIAGDGTPRVNGWSYSSSSYQLINDVQELAVSLGYKSNMCKCKINYVYLRNEPAEHWRVSIMPKTETFTNLNNQKTVHYTGKVYCPTVKDTGVLLVRRHGKIHVSGNSDVVRGQEGHVIILDEMDYMGEEDLVAVIPMLQKTEEDQEDKIVIAASTPTGQRQKFWEWNHDPTFTSFWYPSYCFCKETKITMADGSLKNIEEIQEGDLVQTESGGQKVTRTFVRDFTGDINHLRWYGNSDGITVTDEHPFASVKSKRRQKDYKWDWTKTADLEIREKRNLNSGSLLRSPVFAKESEAPIDMLMLHDDLYESSPGRVKLKRPFKNGVGQNFKNDFPRFVYPDEVCWGSLVGWYLAEGNLDRLSDLYKCYLGVDFTLHINETDYVDELCNLFEKFTLGTPILSKRPAQNSIKVSISNPPFAILLNHLCGIGSKTKKLSPFVMQASKSFQEALLLSYAKGDGYERSSGNFVIRTTSEHIAKQIQMIIAKISDYYPSISVSSSQKERNFNTGYKAYKTAPSWAIEYNTRIRSNLGKTKVSNSDYALLLKSKEKKSFQGKVYNFEVENTNSYIANGILVHNCNPNWDAVTEQRIRAEQTEMQFRHEIEADWGEDASGVYPKRLVDKAFSVAEWEYKADMGPPHSFNVFGIDWDKYGAGVNIVVLEYCTELYPLSEFVGRMRVLYREEISKEEFLLHKAVDRIIELNHIFNPRFIYADQGYGEMQMEHIHMYGKEHPHTGLHKKARAWAFNESIEVPDPYTHVKVKKDLKPFMVDNLRYLLEQEKIVFSGKDDDLYLQLISYIVIRTSMNNRPVFGPGGSAPDHAHDALLLAAFAIAFNYDDLLNPDYAVKAMSVSNEAFLPMFNLETEKDRDIAENVWGEGASAPVYTKRSMSYNSRRSSKPIKRKMF